MVPLIEVRGTSCTMISSPVDKFNFFSQLIDLKDDMGEPLFYTYHLELQCEKCKAKKIKDCVHVPDIIPPWKSEDRHKLVKALYAANGVIFRRFEKRIHVFGSQGF